MVLEESLEPREIEGPDKLPSPSHLQWQQNPAYNVHMKKFSADFFFENFWRLLTNVWTFLFIVLVTADFFYPDKFDRLLTPVALLYGALLSIFVGTKEFSRWYIDRTDRRHPGEAYVILWSILILGMAVYSSFVEGSYRLSSDVISSYIMILTVFALTQASKQAHLSKRSRKRL